MDALEKASLLPAIMDMKFGSLMPTAFYKKQQQQLYNNCTIGITSIVLPMLFVSFQRGMPHFFVKII